jgi:peptidoglycan/xylan/chitin deacetylase (PgdA/CDA1 family)
MLVPRRRAILSSFESISYPKPGALDRNGATGPTNFAMSSTRSASAIRTLVGLLVLASCGTSAVEPPAGGDDGDGGKGGRGRGGGGGREQPGGSGGGDTGEGGAPGAGGRSIGNGGSDTGNGGSDTGSGGSDTGSGGRDTGSGGRPPVPVGGLGPWTGHDNVAPSASPPAGLKPAQVPMLIAFGFDDNGHADGFQWALDEFGKLMNPDGTPARATFYITSTYAGNGAVNDPALMKKVWRQAFMTGFEVGDHSVTHPMGHSYSEEQWRTEIQGCIDTLTKPYDPMEMVWQNDMTKGVGMPREQIYGFRTPYLDYNANVFSVLKALGFHYDASIEEGYEKGQDGTNFLWPYTLDNGSPGNDAVVAWPESTHAPAGKHPGLWELPLHVVIVPPDAEAAKYGVPAGLRGKLKMLKSYYNVDTGFITGLDWNMWYEYGLTKAEFVATMKYTLDLRLRGNRAPLMFGVHSDIYATMNENAPHASAADRRAAVDEFLRYALTKPDVRLVTMKQTLDWVRNPTALR